MNQKYRKKSDKDKKKIKIKYFLGNPYTICAAIINLSGSRLSRS